MTIDENVKKDDKAVSIETVAEPDAFVVNTEAEEVSIYAKLNTKSAAATYDAWCRHSD